MASVTCNVGKKNLIWLSDKIKWVIYCSTPIMKRRGMLEGQPCFMRSVVADSYCRVGSDPLPRNGLNGPHFLIFSLCHLVNWMHPVMRNKAAVRSCTPLGWRFMWH